MIQTRTILLAGLLLALCTLPGCDAQQAAPPAAQPDAATSGKLYVVGTDASYVPFEFQNEQREIVGFDVEVLTAVAAKGGFRVRFVNTAWESIFTALAQGDRDILASAISITEPRRQQMDFSDPYFVARQLIAVGKGNAAIRHLADLKGRKVAVQAGTTGDEALQQLQGAVDVRRFASMLQALRAVESGEVEAMVGDNGAVAHYVASNPRHKLAAVADDASFSPEFYGFAVKKGNRALLDKLNIGIAAIKADGSYDRIYRKYFSGL
ncbi:basic amino acid ABC transporter substrate-binding protein [Vogesella sp. LIG4]|uniref:basic amino acid ABC transporter substrate-binding protein n=1 Tax=Vogesella sp. LIG4 TaxID=1192162 RepID=UPI00081FB539|nr:basic amino acid ABC transporter substrate-binding protein [Vogesella sp. LIG4]SCK23449.1 polar amino acid transport system substrate-binding protein [Vogesella sp. LIG4]